MLSHFLQSHVYLTYLIDLDMVDFDVTLGMDWIYASYATIDCRTRVVIFQFPNDPELE